MLIRRLLICLALGFLPGLTIGRFLIPIWAGKHRSSPTTSANLASARSLFSANTAEADHDPGTSRAIVDDAAGSDDGKEKPIPSLSELLRSTNYGKLYSDGSRFADSLDEEGVRRALTQVGAAPGGPGKQNMQYNLLRRWAELNPQAAIHYVETMKDHEQRDSFYSTIAYAWGAKDFNAAKTWAMTLADRRIKNFALQGILSSLVETDPDQALQLALTLPKSNSGYYGYGYSIFQALSAQNPVTAAQKATALPPGEFREQAMRIVATQWAKVDLDAARHWAETLPPGNPQQSALGNIISQWSRRDPTAAAHYAENIPSGQSRSNIISSVASNWMQEDSAAALAWVETLPKDQARDNAMRNTISQWARDDPRAAADYVMKMTDETQYQNYLSSISHQWASEDPDGALKWARAQNDPKVEENFMTNVLSQWAENEPEKAAAEIQTLKSPEARQRALQQVAGQWAESDPTKAMTWLTTLPADEHRDSAMRNAVANWTRNNPEEVSVWLGQLPNGDTRDKMVGSFAGSVLQTDPEASAAWANVISNQKDRVSGVQWALKNWAKTNRPAATSWVNQQNLSPADRTAFLNTINKVK